MPSLPPSTVGELFYDNAWNAVSVRQTSEILISRGLGSESDTAADPMSCECDLDSRDYSISPRNPESPLFGKIGRNTPFRISIEAGGPYMQCPSGIYDMSAPDNSAMDITGDIDVRVEVRPEDWSDPQGLAARWASGGNLHWQFVIGQDRELWFWWSPTGLAAAQVYAHQDYSMSFANGERVCLRATLDVDNGDGGWTCRFWWAKTIDADNWTQIGTDITGSGVTSLFNATAPMLLGEVELSLLPDSSSGFDRFRGEIYGVQVYDGINDRLAVDLDIARDGGTAAVGGTTVTDNTGFTWTRSGTCSFDNKYYRAVGEVPSWPPTRNLTGSDNFVSIAPTGITRRMDAGNKPIDSALLRFIKDNTPVECWPLTDGPGATAAKSLVGGRDMEILFDPATDNGDPQKLAGGTLADWIEPVIAFPPESNGEISGRVPQIDDLTDFDIDFFLTGGGSRSDGGFRIIDRGAGTDTSPQVEIFMETYGAGGTAGQLPTLWTYRDDSGSSQGLVFSPNPEVDIYSDTDPHHIRLHVEPGSSSTTFDLYVDGQFVDTGSVAFEVRAPRTIKFGAGFTTPANPPVMTDRAYGYFTFWESSSAPSAADMYQALIGFPGETTGERILRLAAENGYTASVSGPNEEQATLGLQDRDKLLALMEEASESDFGYLLERRDALEIYHRGQSTLWNQSPVFELDFTDGVVGAPFRPVDDDKLTENDVSVAAKRGGVPTRSILESGVLSVQDPPNGVGRYDKSFEYSFDSDDQAADASYMRLNMGTYDGVRYTRITLDLANERVFAMLHKILKADVGDKIRLHNVPKDHGPGPIDVLIQGYEEIISPEEWKITFNCRPGAPWTSGQVYLDGEVNPYVWIDTAGCVHNGTADTTTTEITLRTTAEFLWTEDLAHSPYDLRVGGEGMTVLGPHGPNVSNSLFDTSISPWVAQNGTSVFSTDVVFPHPRARGSLKFTPAGGFASGGPLSELSAVGTITPGVTYAMGYWVYSVLGLNDYRAVADWYDSAGVYLSTSGATAFNVPARTWTFVSATAAAPASASSYRLRARYGVDPTTAGIYYIWAPRLTLARASNIYDTFTRTLSDSWGSSDTGNAWTNTGGASTDYDVNGSSGTQSHSAVNTSRYSVTASPSADVDVRCRVSTAALATGDSQFAGPVARWTDANNMYHARLGFTTTGGTQLVIQKRVAGVQTNIVTVTLPWVHTASAVFGIRLKVEGSTLKARAWPIATTTEPRIWHATTTDTALTAAGSVGVRSVLGSSNTNTLPFVFTWDEFELMNPQSFNVTRSENNVVKSHVDSEDARLAISTFVQM